VGVGVSAEGVGSNRLDGRAGRHLDALVLMQGFGVLPCVVVGPHGISGNSTQALFPAFETREHGVSAGVPEFLAFRHRSTSAVPSVAIQANCVPGTEFVMSLGAGIAALETDKHGNDADGLCKNCPAARLGQGLPTVKWLVAGTGMDIAFMRTRPAGWQRALRWMQGRVKPEGWR